MNKEEIQQRILQNGKPLPFMQIHITNLIQVVNAYLT